MGRPWVDARAAQGGAGRHDHHKDPARTTRVRFVLRLSGHAPSWPSVTHRAACYARGASAEPHTRVIPMAEPEQILVVEDDDVTR